MPLRLFDLRQTLKYMYDSISLGDSVLIMQGRQFVLKSGGDKRSDEKTLQQDGKNIE